MDSSRRLAIRKEVREIMNIVPVKTFSEVNTALENGADVVLHEVKRAPVAGYISPYCHVMVPNDDLMLQIKQEFGWSSSNATEEYVTFIVLPEREEAVIADRVTESLKSLASE